MSKDYDERRHHIEGFVEAFVVPERRSRYRTFLLDAKKRSKITDRLNHNIDRDLDMQRLTAKPVRYSLKQNAYLILDSHELDDTFMAAGDAVELLQSLHFGGAASIIPGSLAIVKPESPASIHWLHRAPRPDFKHGIMRSG